MDAPFALIPMDDLASWARLLVTCGIGALAGAIVGLVAGGSLALGGPAHEVAAQRGVTLAVEDDVDRAGASSWPCGRLEQNLWADDYRRETG